MRINNSRTKRPFTASTSNHNFVMRRWEWLEKPAKWRKKIKKIWRDRGGIPIPEDIEAVKKEMGDCLWYLAELATGLGLSFDEVAVANLTKLRDRQQRQQLAGSGDNR